MSIIYCSAKLSTLIGTRILDAPENFQLIERLYGWNAQMFTLHKRKCIIITNKATLYSIIRLDVLKKDLSNLSDFFKDSLLKQLMADDLYDSHEFWEPLFSNVNFYRTDNDKKVIGSINELIFQLKVAIDYNSAGLGQPTDTKAASYLNYTIMGLIRYKTPIESLKAFKNNAHGE